MYINNFSIKEVLYSLKPLVGSAIIAFLISFSMNLFNFHILIYGVIIILIFASILGIYQFITHSGYFASFFVTNESGFYYATGFGTTPLVLALQLLIFTLLSIPIVQYTKSTKLKKIFYLIYSIFGFAFGLTFSRSPWIAFGIMMYIFLIFSRYKKEVIPIFLFFIISMIISILSAVHSFDVKKRFSIDSSALSRVELAKEGIKLFEENVLFGIGYMRYKKEVSEEMLKKFNLPRTSSHNIFIEILVSSGLLGLISFLILLLLGCYNLIQEFLVVKDIYLKEIILGILITSLAVFFVGNFHDLITDKYLWMIIGLMYSNKKKWNNEKDKDSSLNHNS